MPALSTPPIFDGHNDILSVLYQSSAYPDITAFGQSGAFPGYDREQRTRLLSTGSTNRYENPPPYPRKKTHYMNVSINQSLFISINFALYMIHLYLMFQFYQGIRLENLLVVVEKSNLDSFGGKVHN